jgi:hypothetical protein
MTMKPCFGKNWKNMYGNTFAQLWGSECEDLLSNTKEELEQAKKPYKQSNGLSTNRPLFRITSKYRKLSRSSIQKMATVLSTLWRRNSVGQCRKRRSSERKGDQETGKVFGKAYNGHQET